LIETPIDSITEEHLQQLLGRPESKRLDFKADLPDPKDKKKCNDMIADIVAFANSEGGDIVYPSRPAWHDDAYLGPFMAETVEPATIEPMLSGFWRVFGLEHRPMDHLD